VQDISFLAFLQFYIVLYVFMIFYLSISKYLLTDIIYNEFNLVIILKS